LRSFGRPRVLVVDDEEKIRLACERALVRAGYEVTHSPGGEDALGLVERQSFDAVLLDVRMPGIDGPELLQRFRKHDPDAPCIVMSAYADFDAVVELLRNGAREFVHKPFDMHGIIAAIDRALATTHLQVDSALLAELPEIRASLPPEDKAILEEIHKKHADVKVLLLGIFPRSPKAADKIRDDKRLCELRSVPVDSHRRRYC